MLSRIPAYYWAPVHEFLSADPDAIVGRLASSSAFATIDQLQVKAWKEEIDVLQETLWEFCRGATIPPAHNQIPGNLAPWGRLRGLHRLTHDATA